MCGWEGWVCVYVHTYTWAVVQKFWTVRTPRFYFCFLHSQSRWFSKNHCSLNFKILPSIFPSIRIFSSESTLCIRWPKCWSFSFSISPSNEYSGLISLRIGWFDIAVQGTLKSLLQHHHNLKASILWCSAFFTAQLSQPYTVNWKNHSFE